MSLLFKMNGTQMILADTSSACSFTFHPPPSTLPMFSSQTKTLPFPWRSVTIRASDSLINASALLMEVTFGSLHHSNITLSCATERVSYLKIVYSFATWIFFSHTHSQAVMARLLMLHYSMMHGPMTCAFLRTGIFLPTQASALVMRFLYRIEAYAII